MPLDATAGLMPAATDAAPVTLASAALANMQETFRDGGHRPSPEQWDAITDYLEHAERAANGDLACAVYLSAIPAGTGKSVAVAAFAGAVARSPAHAAVGVLIAVNRISEARDMAEALKDHRAKLGLIVGAKHATELQAMGGHLEADTAQIVVTTQAALKETMRRAGDFNAAARYFFNGERRRVVLWDEAISFNRPVVLDGDAVVKLAAALRRQSGDAAAALKRWSADLDSHPAGLCTVPDFTSLGVDFVRLEQEAETDEQAAQARALSIISGEAGHVLRSNASASSLVTYVPELPSSLMPVLVTDASAARGVHHQSYQMMSSTRPVVRLKEATKAYTNLTLRIVPTAASRSIYRKVNSHEGRDLIDMIVGYIRRVALEPVLVVSYKSAFTIHGIKERTIRDAVDARLTDDERARVSHMTWGSHTATNDHKAVARVVFAGLNFMPAAAAYAASGAALGKPMNTAAVEDHPTGEQVKDMERGMLRDSTLQAVLRGAARMGIDGDCGRQEVVIPQAPQTGLSTADYMGMFPGCKVARDLTLLPLKPLKGRLLKCSAVVLRRHEAGDHEITDPSIYGELEMGRADYGKLKRKEEWVAWLSAVGWHQAKLGGGIMGLRRRAV